MHNKRKNAVRRKLPGGQYIRPLPAGFGQKEGGSNNLLWEDFNN